MFDLTGKCALVTGASGGIGAEIARVLHGQGAAVGLSGTRTGALAALAAALEETAGAGGTGRVHVLPCNLGEPAAVDALAKDASQAMGQVDILVHNAGVTRDNLFLRMKDEEWDEVLAVNLTACFRLTRGCLRGMMRRRWGRVIGVASIIGWAGGPGQGNYAASKAGLTGMMKALAREVASRGVTANCIAPGFVETPMTAELAPAQREALLASVPAGRPAAAAEIAAAAAYLASNEAAYVTGATLHINGGAFML